MHVSAQRIFGPHVRFFALRNIPWLCRVVKLGEESAITGAKSSIGVMTSNLSEDWVKQQLEPLFVVQKSGPRGGAKCMFTDVLFIFFAFFCMFFHGFSWLFIEFPRIFHGYAMDFHDFLPCFAPFCSFSVARGSGSPCWSSCPTSAPWSSTPRTRSSTRPGTGRCSGTGGGGP